MPNQANRVNLTIKNLKKLETNLMLKLSQKERIELLEELSEIINKFENYSEINLSNTLPTNFSVISKQCLRKDTVITSANKEKIIKTSKNYSNNYICINDE